MEEKRSKWFLLQPEQKDEISTKDRVVIIAMLSLFILSVFIWKQTQNETAALAVMSIVAVTGAADALYELRQPHVKRAHRRYLSIGIGCIILFFVMLYLITKQIVSF